MELTRALELFGLTESDLQEPSARERLEKKHRELLTTWHPHRYANLTNNPRKYMKMYKQGEAMTKDIHAAYELLVERLVKQEGC